MSFGSKGVVIACRGPALRRFGHQGRVIGTKESKKAQRAWGRPVTLPRPRGGRQLPLGCCTWKTKYLWRGFQTGDGVCVLGFLQIWMFLGSFGGLILECCVCEVFDISWLPWWSRCFGVGGCEVWNPIWPEPWRIGS